MTERRIKFVREGNYGADVEMEVLRDDDPQGWGPYLTPESAERLDKVRKALRTGDIRSTQELAKRVYLLSPVAAE